MNHVVKIRANHNYAFRSGEWAVIVGLGLSDFERLSQRMCYLVVFPDGVTDAWPVYDEIAQYEFDPVEVKW